jgi:hypothetical protein
MNQSYNQFNGVPRRHQEDGGRGVGVMSGLVVGASAASAALYGGESYQGRINGKYNTRIDALNSSKVGKMQEARKPFVEQERGAMNNANAERSRGAAAADMDRPMYDYYASQHEAAAGRANAQGNAAAQRVNSRINRATGRMQGMRDSHWINKTMNSKPAQFLGGSGKRKAATIATTAVLGGLLGGAMDNPNA